MRRAFLAAAVLAVTVAPAADAKEIARVELCGADGCRVLAIPRGLHEWPGGQSPGTDPPPVAPFVEVRITINRVQRETMWFVPSATLFAARQRGGGIRWSGVYWQTIDRIISRAALRIEPHRPRVVAAMVDGVRVSGDPSSYLRLFRLGTEAAAGGAGLVRVSLETDPPSPWVETALSFHPEKGLLQRGDAVVRLSAGVAADLRAARPVGAKSSLGFDWPLSTGWLLGAVTLAIALALVYVRPRIRLGAD